MQQNEELSIETCVTLCADTSLFYSVEISYLLLMFTVTLMNISVFVAFNTWIYLLFVFNCLLFLFVVTVMLLLCMTSYCLYDIKRYDVSDCLKASRPLRS